MLKVEKLLKYEFVQFYKMPKNYPIIYAKPIVYITN